MTWSQWSSSRSQWSNGSMTDCSARGPGIESRCGQLCLSQSHCDLQPWARAVCTLPTVPRSTQPSTLRGMVNEYQLSGWVIFEVEYLKDVASYSYGQFFYRTLIGNHMQSIEWYHFQWPWVTSDTDYKVKTFLKSNILKTKLLLHR